MFQSQMMQTLGPAALPKRQLAIPATAVVTQQEARRAVGITQLALVAVQTATQLQRLEQIRLMIKITVMALIRVALLIPTLQVVLAEHLNQQELQAQQAFREVQAHQAQQLRVPVQPAVQVLAHSVRHLMKKFQEQLGEVMSKVMVEALMLTVQAEAALLAQEANYHLQGSLKTTYY